jgi:nitroimidazol reductase NimA-like FMN-containing flavoprotein (pyridoxamine 5'-phosphate oxidase superfamily)
VLDAAEMAAIVERNYWGVLSTVDDGQPYSIPIIYGYDGAFYSVLREGRKMRSMAADPRVCMNIVEVENMAKVWRSVLAFGRAGFIVDDEEMARAIAVIRAQYPGMATRSGGSMSGLRAQGYRVLRMTVDEMTGRAQD